jgi:hypothetical protein
VERSGTKIAAECPTEFTKNVVVPENVLNEGTPKKSIKTGFKCILKDKRTTI